MKFLKKNKSEFKKSAFVFMFFMGLSSVVRAEELKKEEKVDVPSKEIVTVDHIEDEKIENNEKEEKVSGTVDCSVYGGGKSKINFKLINFKLNKQKKSFMESITDVGFNAFLGSKIMYNVPTFFSPVHFDVKVLFSKSSFHDSDFEVSLPLAYLKLDKIYCFSDFKLGMTNSLFNSNNTGIPQIQTSYEFNPSWKLVLGIEVSSSDAYFKISKDEKGAKEIALNSNGTLSSVSNPDWIMTKTDINPLALAFSLKYEDKDILEISSSWLIKFAAPYKLEKSSSGEQAYGGRLGMGLNSQVTAYLLSKNTKLNVQTIIGRGIGSNMSDYLSSFIVDQEASKKDFYFATNKNDVIDIKSCEPVIFWGLRFSCGITQKFLRDYSFDLSYNMATAGEKFNKLLVYKEDASKGYEKEHKVKGIFTWNKNDEDKVKLFLGSSLSLFCKKEHPLEIYAGFKVDFS